MKIVAFRPDEQEPAYIVADADKPDPSGRGWIVIPARDFVGPHMAIASFLARGYWQDVPKDLDAAVAKNVLRLAETKGQA